MLPPELGGNKKCYHLSWEVTQNVTTRLSFRKKKIDFFIEDVRTFYKTGLLIN